MNLLHTHWLVFDIEHAWGTVAVRTSSNIRMYNESIQFICFAFLLSDRCAAGDIFFSFALSPLSLSLQISIKAQMIE